MTVKIVTDSIADLPAQVVNELGITVIPLNVRFGTEVYRDGVDLTTEYLGSKFPKGCIFRSKTTPVIGTHTGPGLLLIAVLGDKGEV